MPRTVPKALYDEVFSLATAIAQPDAEPLSDADDSVASDALAKLTALFERKQDAGEPDPFLTEALADFIEDDVDAIRLYELALSQCAVTPGEPTHTKRIGLTRRLLQVGRKSEAREEFARARRDAFAASDAEALSELDELAIELTV